MPALHLARSLPLKSVEVTDDGLQYQSNWRPSIQTSSNALGTGIGGNALTLTGLKFEGLSEASAGGTSNNTSNCPVVEIRSLNNDQLISLSPDPKNPWSDSGFTSLTIPSTFPQGCATATVFTNGIPSSAVIVRLVHLNFAPASLSHAKAGVSYSQVISAQNGTAPYHSFSITTGALPAGLELSDSGILSGTPTVTGTFNFSVGAFDSTPVSGSQAYTLTVNQLLPTQTIAASSSAQRGPTVQTVKLSASVVVSSGNTAINEGSVTFNVLDVTNSEVSAPVTSTPLVNGAASADYTLPANMAVGQYTIKSTFNGTANFDGSSNTANLFVITPGGGTAPAVQIVSIDRNPARVGTPVTITAQGNSFSGLPLTYTWVLFIHGGQLPIGQPLQVGPDNVLIHAFTAEGDFDIGVSASDSYAGAGTVQRLEILPLEPNSGSDASNIFGDGTIVSNPINALGIRLSSSVGGALNLDSVANTGSSALPSAGGRAVAETYTFKIDGQAADPNSLKAINSAAKFSTHGIHVIQLDALQGSATRQARLMVPIGNSETGEVVTPDTRKNTGTMKYSIDGKLSLAKKSTVKLSNVIEISEGLLLSDLGEIEIGISNFHTKITVNSKGRILSGPDDSHFSMIKVMMPKIDNTTRKTIQGASMTILFALTGAGTDLADNGLGTEGISPTTTGSTQAIKSAKPTPQPRALHFAAVVGGRTYQSAIPITFTANSDFGTISGRSKK